MVKFIRSLIVIVVMVIVPSQASANIGLPTITVAMPWLILFVLPVIALEAWILKKRLKLATKQAAVTSAIANLTSTLLGIPATWLALLAVQFATGGSGINYDFDSWLGKFLSVTWQAPWLMPFEGDFHWMLPSAMAFLFVPFFSFRGGWRRKLFGRAIMTILTRSPLMSYVLTPIK